MTDERAREILKPYLKPDNSLTMGDDSSSMEYMDYSPNATYTHERVIILDGTFTVEEIEAIAYWLRAYPPCQATQPSASPTP